MTLEEIKRKNWYAVDEQLREHHRDDLMQVLAYSTLFNASRVIACLMYPCRVETYTSLLSRGYAYTCAKVIGGSRHVEVVLAAAPMGLSADQIARSLIPIIKNIS